MPNFSKDNTMDDPAFLYAARVLEFDLGDESNDMIFLALQYADTPEAMGAKDWKVAKFYFPKYAAPPLASAILECAGRGGVQWVNPYEKAGEENEVKQCAEGTEDGQTSSELQNGSKPITQTCSTRHISRRRTT
jgi:hypothetical protein